MDSTDTSASFKPRPREDRSPHQSQAKGRGRTSRSGRTHKVPTGGARSTVVDIDSVRRDEASVELLETAAEEDGLKRKGLGPMEWTLMVLVLWLVLLLLPVSIWFCVRVVREHERAVVFRLGHVLRGKPRGPGLLFVLPVLDVCHIVDIRLKTLKIPLHTVVTKDPLRAELSALCYYQTENVALCCSLLFDLESTLESLVRGVIRDVLSQQPLSLVLTQRRNVGQSVQSAADALLCHWGVRLQRVDIEELSFPEELQRRGGQTWSRPSQVQAADVDPWDGLRSSLRLLHPALVLPLPPDLLNVAAEPSPLPPPPPPVAMETDTGSTPALKRDSPMM